MMLSVKSCTVALPRECNCATPNKSDATMPATVTQHVTISTLAYRVLSRNRSRNQNATRREMECNFLANKNHQSCVPKIGQVKENIMSGKTDLTLPVWCDPVCPWREILTLPQPDGGKEETPGCVNPRLGNNNTWRRLSRLDGCPARWRMNRPYTST